MKHTILLFSFILSDKQNTSIKHLYLQLSPFGYRKYTLSPHYAPMTYIPKGHTYNFVSGFIFLRNLTYFSLIFTGYVLHKTLCSPYMNQSSIPSFPRVL